MMRPRATIFVTAMVVALFGVAVRAAGVAMVVQRGGEGRAEAKNGFLQGALGAQLPGLNAKAFEVDGTDGDAAALAALKEQAPTLVFAAGPAAARGARKALPEAWVVYAMVFFPEVEGFLQDPKMVGIASLGSAKDLGAVLKALVGKPKGLAVIHDTSVASAVPDLLLRLKSDAGIEARGISVDGPAGLANAVAGLKGQAPAALFLPDPASLDGEAFKAAVASCLANNIIPVALADSLVASGALCGAYYPPEEIGAQGARVAKEILADKAPESKLVAPSRGATSCNRVTASGLKVKFPKEFHPETVYE